MKKKILLVEDDNSIIKSLSCLLEEEGFAIDSVKGQTAAIEQIGNKDYDLILVDLSLEDGNGYNVCTAAKKMKDVAVFFLTAAGDEMSVVTGLSMGADDYVAKPFRPMELIARINSAISRKKKNNSVFVIEGIKVDTEMGLVFKRNEDGVEKEIFLSALEYRILLLFINNKGMVITRNKLLEHIWDAAGEFVNDNTLNVYIRRLREKIEDNPAEPTIIKTIRGMGYRLG